MYCYLASIIVVWVTLISSFNEHLIKKQTWIPNFGSVAAVIGLVMLDIIVPLYHSIFTHAKPPLRPSYDAYIIFAIYIYLPMNENLHSAILGFTTTFCYLVVTYAVTYRLDDHAVIKVISEIKQQTYYILTTTCVDLSTFLCIKNKIYVFFSASSFLVFLGNYRPNLFTWYQFLWSVCACFEQCCHPPSISRSSRLC